MRCSWCVSGREKGYLASAAACAELAQWCGQGACLNGQQEERGGRGGCDLYPFHYFQCQNAAYKLVTAGFLGWAQSPDHPPGGGSPHSHQCTLTAACSLFVTTLNWLEWFLYSSFFCTLVLWFPNHSVKSIQLLTSHVEKQCWIYEHAVCLEALPYFSLKNLFRLHKINRQEPLGFLLVVLPLFCLASQLSIDPKVRLLFVARPKWQPPTLTMLLSSYHLSYGGHIVMLWQCC